MQTEGLNSCESDAPESVDVLNGIFGLFTDIVHDYTRPEMEGIENIPAEGPALIIPNHSGFMAWDAVVLINEIIKQGHRIPRTMLHDFWHNAPVIKDIIPKMGLIPQDMKLALRVLKRKQALLVFPEAEEGNFKPLHKMYQLQQFNPGYIALASITGAPIVPVCILGGEEAHLNLGSIDWFKDLLGARIPLPLNLIPMRVKWKLIFMKPVFVPRYSRTELKDPEKLGKLSERIRKKIQLRIHRELKQRGMFHFVEE